MSDRLTAESQSLGCIINNSALLSLALSRSVTPASFADPLDAAVFSAMLRLIERDGNFDLVTLASELPDNMLYLSEISIAAVTSANFTTYLDVVKRHEASRELALAASTAQKDLAENLDVRDVAAQLSDAAGKALSAIDGSKIPELADLSSGIDKLLDNPTPCIPFFPMGTEGRSRLQFHPGELMVLGGGTGTGKTALACTAAVTQIEEGVNKQM